MWLKKNDHEVIETRNGAEALQAIEAGPVDLIVSDMNMPLVTGEELARVVRQDKKLTTPILMLSSRCDQISLSERMKAYDVTLYPKPFIPSQLVAQIDRLLGAGVAAGASGEVGSS
jgi:adenylate cyclase